MRATVLILSIVFAGCYFSSCTTDQALQLIPIDTCTNNGLVTMSYSLHIVPILTTKCTDPAFGGDCHYSGSAGPVDLTIYDNLKAEIEAGLFDFYVLDEVTATMPEENTKGPKELSTCDKERLQLWIDQGYPQN